MNNGKQIAQTILEQLGSVRRLVAMTGAFSFTYDENTGEVAFRFKGSKKANVCTITLDPSDTYTMKLHNLNTRTFSSKLVFELSGMYAEDLRPTFERFTGLYLSL